MNLDSYVERIVEQLVLTAAAGGPQAESVAGTLVLPLRSAVRLALLESLSAAADELTLELAPGSVEVRLRGGEPSFVIDGVAAVPPTSGPADPVHVRTEAPPTPTGELGTELEEGSTTRINLRMSESLKARVEAAALSEGRSVNAWLVRAATAALNPSPTPPGVPSTSQATTRRGAKRVTGWAQ